MNEKDLKHCEAKAPCEKEHKHCHCEESSREHNHNHAHSHSHEHGNEKTESTVLIVGAIIYAAAFVIHKVFMLPTWSNLLLFTVPYALLGGEVIINALKSITHGEVFDENFLMAVSTLGAFAIGNFPEAAAVMLFYRVGEAFEGRAVAKSRKSIKALLNIMPDNARVERDGILSVIPVDKVNVGDTVVIYSGEKIAADGVVIDGEASVDTSAVTGEAVPVRTRVDSSVVSGCINKDGALKIKAEKKATESTAAKIIELVESASEKKAPAEQFITKFARYYTPVVVIFALLLAVIPPILFKQPFSEWLRRALTFLVISCPCALVISVPLAFFGGIGASSKHGVLIKGGNYLEALDNVSQVMFDKTGTLTKGVFKVTRITASNGFTEKDIVQYAAKAEIASNHPTANAIKAYCAEKYTEQKPNQTHFAEIAGHGVSAEIDGDVIFAGNEKLMNAEGIAYEKSESVGTNVYVAVNGVFAGCITISDEIKDGCALALKRLKSSGIESIVMLTGDSKVVAESVAKELNIDEFKAELLPDEKVENAVEISQKSGRKFAFAGDGINDAPLIARADVGIAMGAIGSDAAIEAADVVLMSDDIEKLAEAKLIARHTKKVVTQNIVFAIGVKLVFLLLGALGVSTMWAAVFADVGVMVIAVINSARLIKSAKKI